MPIHLRCDPAADSSPYVIGNARNPSMSHISHISGRYGSPMAATAPVDASISALAAHMAIL